MIALVIGGWDPSLARGNAQTKFKRSSSEIAAQFEGTPQRRTARMHAFSGVGRFQPSLCARFMARR